MNDLPQTRQSLLIELGKRSDVAWSEFLNVYENAIVRYCIRRGLQEADARDAAQMVYAAIQHKVAEWDHDAKRGSFRAWLFRVARNISVDLISARSKAAVSGDSRISVLLSEMSDHRQTDPDESTVFQLEWRRALFEWAASQVQHEVREVTWQAFCLTAIEGQSAEAVANQLRIPVGSVYTAKCRVVARIRNKVGEWSDDLPAVEEPNRLD